MTAIIPLTKIGFYNPGRLSDAEIEQSFIARVPFFEFIFKKIIAEKPNSIPQQHLVIGQRGMGKSSLLTRIAAELRKKPYKNTFIPLSFPEEQYNIDRLSKFWLNCLDALADALDKEKHISDLTSLDSEILKLTKEKDLSSNSFYEVFKLWAGKTKRRPVLLVDNLNLIFAKISKEEQHQLRAVLISEGAPILIGTSAAAIEETVDYKAPFYDAFQISYLKKLTFDESIDVLLNLAKITGNESFEDSVYREKGRLEALYQLTGGTPRTLAILFPLIQGGFSVDIQTDLDALMDIITPIYKARFEELPAQLQVVLDAVALHWDPINIEQLREVTMLDNGQLSPQLKRLVEFGWLEKLDAYKAKGSAYEVSERFFNVWYLMRRSSRRQKRELYCLTKFLESFYGDGLQKIAKSRIYMKSENVNQAALELALADAVKGKLLSIKLRKKAYEALIEMSLHDESIARSFTIPTEVIRKKVLNLITKADNYYKKNKFIEAESCIINSLKIDENNKHLWVLLGIIYNDNLNKYDEAEVAYKKAINLDEKDADYWNYLGKLYEEHFNKYLEAEIAYKKAIKLDEKKIDYWHDLANLYEERLGKYLDAEVAYKKSIELNNINADSWCQLAFLYLNYLGKYEEAEGAYKKAIELDKKMALPWNNLGFLYSMHLSKHFEAEAAYKKAIDLDKDDAYPWVGLGNLYQNFFNKFIEAEIAYKNAIELDENNADSWNNLGNLYQHHLNRYLDAEIAYKKAIIIDENDPYPWSGLGDLFNNYLKKYNEAEAAYKKAIELDEKNANLWNNLGILYQEHMHEYLEAEKAYKKAIELDEKNADYWDELGNLYADCLHKHEDAQAAYLKALEIDPVYSWSKYNLLFLWRDKMNKINEARALFSTIEKSNDLKDSYLLNEALFAYYEKNIGIAQSLLTEALLAVGDILPVDTMDDWYRAAGVIVKLGFGDSLLSVLSGNGYDVVFKPLYIAIEALTKNEDELFFNNIAAEVREPAKQIMEIMKNYMR